MSKATIGSFGDVLKKLYPSDLSDILYKDLFRKKPVCKHGEELGKCKTGDPECLVQEIMET